MNIASFNIRHGTDMLNRHTLNECAQAIVNARVDIAALQEVDRHWGERSNNEDQAALLAELTGLTHMCFAGALTNEHDPAGHYGNAILSRYPLDNFNSHALPQCPGREKRRALEALITDGSSHITVFNTHLCLDKNTAADQLRAIINMAVTRPGAVLIMGDFNAGPDDLPMRQIFKNANCVFQDAEWTLYQRHTPTYPANRPKKKIDYILANSAAMKSSGNFRVIDSQASDHRPVMIQTE